MESLPEPTARALEKLDITRVLLAGGPQAVAPAVAEQLSDVGIAVERGDHPCYAGEWSGPGE